jgi:RimJ/RimL family protein N-acetyltransferase
VRARRPAPRRSARSSSGLGFPERVETPRLVLRRWAEEDREALAAIWSDPDVWRSLRPGVPFQPRVGEERLHHHIRHWDVHGFGLWALVERASGEVAGWAGASHPSFVPEVAEEVEIGWTLRRPFWGRGLATEAASEAVEASFAHLDRDTLISLIDPGNERSIAVARRLGMTEGRTVGTAGLTLRVYSISR